MQSPNTYKATHFEATMKDFVFRRMHPSLSGSYSITRASHIKLGFSTIDCFDRLGFNYSSVTGIESPDGPEYDVIEVKPWKVYANKHTGVLSLSSGRQDTCLIQDLNPDEYPGLSSGLFLSSS